MILLVLIPVALVAVLVGVNLGWRWVFAPLLGYALLHWLLASLRALVAAGRPGAAVPGDEPAELAPNERTMFWCEECGTEVLLVVRGTARAPSHCGQRMHERTELLSD